MGRETLVSNRQSWRRFTFLPPQENLTFQFQQEKLTFQPPQEKLNFQFQQEKLAFQAPQEVGEKRMKVIRAEMTSTRSIQVFTRSKEAVVEILSKWKCAQKNVKLLKFSRRFMFSL